MKYIIALIIGILGITKSQAQQFEVGAYGGGANVIGDVGNTTYINPNDVALGGIFKWNRSERHSFRFSLIYAQTSLNDADSSEERRKERGYSFDNSILEFSAGMEYTFWEFDLNSGNPASTPYIYTGASYLLYEESRFLGGMQSDFDQGRSFAIPIALGYKATLGTNFIAALEIGARYTFTDNLDGSNPISSSDGDILAFGNKNNNDWYVFTGITLSYTFGRQPCYCNF